jgi:hypothetical protein
MTVTFEDAIAQTENLLNEIVEKKLEEAEIEKAIASLVNSLNGARGFFVTYLTADHPLADNPSTGVIKALQSSPEIVSELLVKNLAMSSAMALTHRRDNNEEMALSSQKVTQRTTNLIKQLNLDITTTKLEELQESVKNKNGNYQNFLERWGYDEEQLAVISQTVSKVLSM